MGHPINSKIQISILCTSQEFAYYLYPYSPASTLPTNHSNKLSKPLPSMPAHLSVLSTSSIPYNKSSCQYKELLNMWKWFTGGKKQLDLQRTYIRVEFLTPDQKRLKRDAIVRLEKEYGSEEEQIIPYDGSFTVSYKMVMNTTSIAGGQEPIKNKMLLNQLICHLEVTKDEQLAEFINTYVEEIQAFFQNDQMVGRNDVLPLYSEVEASVYRPQEVLEIIYEPKSLWERIKNKAKKIVKSVPSTIFSIFAKIAGLILGYLGFGGGMSSVMWKMLPTTSILQWVVSALSIFFPMLGPLLNMGTKFLL